jgi:hypothetical protein
MTSHPTASMQILKNFGIKNNEIVFLCKYKFTGTVFSVKSCRKHDLVETLRVGILIFNGFPRYAAKYRTLGMLI